MQSSKTLAMLLLGLAGLLSTAWGAETPHAATFKPGQVWLDTDGKPIQAFAGGVLFDRGTYYWYGMKMDGPTRKFGLVDFLGVPCYSSKDLYNCKNEGIVLRPQTADCAYDLHPSKFVERPKVVFNRKTGKYVMWVHIDFYPSGYGCLARAGVAVADGPTGPFKYLGSILPDGLTSRDQTVFCDDDQKAYRIYSSENNSTTCISLLTNDYQEHAGRFVRALGPYEAHAIFKADGKYYWIGSNCTGWNPNAARSAVADSIWGPWKELGNPCIGKDAEKTFFSQCAFVLPVAGKKNAFIFMADRWNQQNQPDSRQVWLPIQFDHGKPRIEWLDQWDLSFFDKHQ
jgi:hypothetical protein